jgi:ketosteroid isomerase-like protein
VDEVHAQIEELVDRETRAWDTQDVDLLLSLFHPDMVWPWPPTPHAHDPLTWRMGMGRFDRRRWAARYRALFAEYRLVRNVRELKRIAVSEEGDAALAVVDIDTLWRTPSGETSHWQGRTCKVYARVGGEWKMTMHTGVLAY